MRDIDRQPALMIILTSCIPGESPETAVIPCPILAWIERSVNVAERFGKKSGGRMALPPHENA
jgi:hypothetical protein